MSGLEAHFRLNRKGFSLDARFSAPETGVTGIFGPSGSGKTSLLRLVAGLDRANKGWLTLDGKVWQDDGRFLRPHRRPVGYVFQDARLFPHLDVSGNLAFAEKRAGSGPVVVGWEELVSLLGLLPLLDRRVTSLSGGEKQRVAIARALLSHPRLLLMDEPLASLDRNARREILPYLEKLVRRLSIPMLYVSHDLGEIERLADHLVLIQGGRITAAGPLGELASDPELPLARDPDGAALVAARIDSFDARYNLTSCSIGPHAVHLPGEFGLPGDERRLRIRAADVSLSLRRPENTSILNILPCRIAEMDAVADGQVLVVLALENTEIRLLARITARSRDALVLAPGLPVQAQIKGMSLVAPDR